MSDEFRYGQRLYYVPKFDARLARHVPITQLRLSQVPPSLVLGHHMLIFPRKQQNGKLAQTRIGSFWISKAAYEVHRARLFKPVWRRLLGLARPGKLNG